MKYDDIKPQTYYKFIDPYNDGSEHLIFVIGRDPFTTLFVASCKDWIMNVSVLEYEDAEYMEKI